jgi:hypothetical protein
MSLPKTLLTVALCFGIGLGLAPTIRSAHACSCVDTAYWRLALEEISDDSLVEQDFWSAEASLQEDSLFLVDDSVDGGGRLLELERVQ